MNSQGSDTYIVVIQTEDGARQKFIAAMTHAKCMLENGESVELRVGPALEPVTIRQRKFFKDVVCQQIAEQVCLGPKRERYTKAAWAEHFRKEFLGNRYEMVKLPGAKKATPRTVRNSTEELGVKRYSAHIDKVIDTAVLEYGVVFHFEASEREAASYVRKPGKEKQQ